MTPRRYVKPRRSSTPPASDRVALQSAPARSDAFARELNVDLGSAEVIDPRQWPKREEYTQELLRIRRHRRGNLERARQLMTDPMWFAPMMLRMGDADGMVGGVTRHVRKTMQS